ncbi:hypothetical protein L0663_01495 [Dyadobacter sp. CY107]|uniref:hypothetical protein n=1 Tax=Dyadobacter fanqingshengii TaxID=2906443 RepID=UPI001F47176E|nr:hypothetical protein [Dyadobacter fanqingshengii]MCF2502038.1 hypothetical protein [Dyadobacter fanqingshengii]
MGKYAITYVKYMVLNNKLVELAAANNAKLCNIVCQANGAPGVFRDQTWSCIFEVPMYYSNIVTLKASCDFQMVESIAQSIRGKVPIKDSFDTLQLPKSKYDKLFDAKWFVASLTLVKRRRYRVVETMYEINKWEKAMSDSAVAGIFNYKVLTHPAVRIIAIHRGEEIVSGCVLTRSEGVVGLSNFSFIPASRTIIGRFAFLQRISLPGRCP